MTKRVALYARVSTKDKGQDHENQLIQLRAFAKTQDWSIVHEYVDKASGKRSDREQFQKMFALHPAVSSTYWSSGPWTD